MAASWSLRHATKADRDFLYALHVRALRDYVEATWGWDEEFQRQHFDDRFDPATLQIIQVNGEDVGMLRVRNRADDLFLVSIQVDPDWQGRGIGSSIIQDLIGKAGTKPVTLAVLKANPRAFALYQRHGFAVVDETDTHFWMCT